MIVFEGEPAKKTFANPPEGLISGMNKFLRLMEITFRRDPTNFRPRINKYHSRKDKEQKEAGCYFLVDEEMMALRGRGNKKEEEEESSSEEEEKKPAAKSAKPAKPAKKQKKGKKEE